MDVGLQAKLLRALQERRIRPVGGVEEVETDVRIIAACNADLPRYVEEGKFRTDLFYRLNTFPIHIPPLRERREDIPSLCRSLLDELSRKLKRRLELTPEALERLLAHNWPGNVRELRNVLEFCAYLTPSGVITELSLPENLRTGPTAQPPLTLAQRTRTFERRRSSACWPTTAPTWRARKKPPHNSVSRWPRFTTSWRHLTIHSFPKLTSKNLEVYFTFLEFL